MEPLPRSPAAPPGLPELVGGRGVGERGRQPADGSRTPCLAPAPPRGRPPVPPGPGAAGSPRAARRGVHPGLRAGAARRESRVVLPKADKRHKFSAFALFSTASGSWMLLRTFCVCACSRHEPVLCKGRDSPWLMSENFVVCVMLDNIL